jgi:RNA polymerase sigma factor (sigma-70 family)
VQKPFEQIVDEYGPTVLRVCRAVLGPADAEDAWAETFLSALKAYPDLDPAANVEAWLVTIAHRRAIDAKRAESRRAVPVARVPDAVTHGDLSDDAAVQDLWQALAALPSKQRQTVAYHHLAGFTHREVAEIVGGSEAAARRAAADGISNLRKTLTTAHEESGPR